MPQFISKNIPYCKEKNAKLTAFTFPPTSPATPASTTNTLPATSDTVGRMLNSDGHSPGSADTDPAGVAGSLVWS